MAKAVKSVGRALKKVVSGVTKVVKKIASSKIGRIILAAATVYFGGAALMGAMGGASGGVMGAISGAGSGLSSAAAGIGNAWTSLLGGNLTGAGTALAEGFMGTGGQIAASAGSEALSAAGALGDTSMSASAASGGLTGFDFAAPAAGGPSFATSGLLGEASPSLMTYSNGAGVGSSLSAATVPAPTSSGLLGQIMNSRYMGPALVTGGTQLVGGLLQGYGASQAQKEQIARDEELRRKYGANIGYDAGWKKYG